MFLALIAFDYAQSGEIRVQGVSMKQPHEDITLTASLPYGLGKGGIHGLFEFSFDIPDTLLNNIFPMRLGIIGCVRNIEYEQPLLLAIQHFRQKKCHHWQDVGLDELNIDEYGSRLKIDIEKPAKQKLHLSLVRGTILDINQRAAAIAVAIYLLCLLSIRSFSQLKRFHYILCVVGLFVYTFLPQHYDFKEWWGWFRYIGSGLAIAVMVLMGMHWSATRSFYMRIDHVQQRVLAMSPNLFLSICVVGFFILIASLSQILFDGMPHVSDTHLQYMQSKLFSEGKLYDDSHPLRQFFDFQSVINDGKYYSGSFPGHALLLTVGQLVHLPWLINPLMAALTVWLVYLIANELAGRAAGYISALLMFVSPMIVFMSSGYMNHVSSMMFLMLFLYAYIRMLRTQRIKYALIAGSAVGFALLIRVQAAVPFALPIALHAIWWFLRHPVQRFRMSATLAISFTLMALLLMYYQYQTTGDPWISGYAVKGINKAHMFLQFLNIERWYHIWGDIGRNIEQFRITHGALFGWPTSSLWGVFLLYLFRLHPQYSFLVLLPIIGQYTLFMCIFPNTGSGVFLDNRNVYEASACFIILTGIAMSRIAVIGDKTISSQPLPVIRGGITATLLSLVILAFPYNIIDEYRKYANNYWEGNWGYSYMIESSVEKPALVFVGPYKWYRLLFYHQPPRDGNSIIIAKDRGGRNEALMEYYPDRHVYRVNKWHIQKIR